jgi:hypothetical protein
VAVNAHRAPSPGGWNCQDFVDEISSKYAIVRLHRGAGRDDHVDIANGAGGASGRSVGSEC